MNAAQDPPKEVGKDRAVECRCCPHLWTDVTQLPGKALEERLTSLERGFRARQENHGVRRRNLVRKRHDGAIKLLGTLVPHPRFAVSRLLRAASAQLNQYSI